MEKAAIQLHTLELFEDGGSYIDKFRLYYAYFKQVPSIKTINRIDNKKLRNWLDTEWQSKIIAKHTEQEYNREESKLMYAEAFYLLDNGLLVNLYGWIVRVLHNELQEDIAKEFLLELKKFTKRRSKNQDISIVVNEHRGIGTTAIKLKKPKLHLAEYYNSDLLPLHEKMITHLKQMDKSGLYLFHGQPGTGKSTYIRYLVRSISKKVIFMSPGVASNLDAPNLANLLLSNSNAVFVIEDAEELITSRELGKNSSISMLLNLTDGLLGESLGIQIIATFNTGIHNIDQALLRKGRLLGLYEFKPLAIDKSQALMNTLGHTNFVVRQPMTLADIFNLRQEDYQLKKSARPQIGFLSN